MSVKPATLETVWVLGPDANMRNAVGIFTTHEMAKDFHKWELKSKSNIGVSSQLAIRLDDGPDAKSTRIYLLGAGPFELATDYKSEETQQREALRASGLSKLTSEERDALGLYF